jgi:protein-tyrosine phosphatase
MKNNKTINIDVLFLLFQTGKVLVHCSSGARMSPAIAIAYLMLKEQIPIWNAVKRIRRCRKVCPSNGLIMQLCSLNRDLFEDVKK